MVLGGVDSEGPHLWQVHPHGSSETVPFSALGSGQMAALSVLESKWRPDLSLDDATGEVRWGLAW